MMIRKVAGKSNFRRRRSVFLSLFGFLIIGSLLFDAQHWASATLLHSRSLLYNMYMHNGTSDKIWDEELMGK